VVLESTHINALQYVDLAHLLEYQHQA